VTTPSATYRLQFRNGMNFERVAELASYLARLGISHLYSSPIFQAEPGSTHGYDVVDNRVIDPQLGGEGGFAQMITALRAEGIGLILDFVPNHMSASTRNPYWRDVLEWGERSDYAQFFDIDWAAPKLLVPALTSSYGQALAQGDFGLHFNDRDGGLAFTYGDLKLPLTPTSYAQVLVRAKGEEFAEWARRFAVATSETSADLKAELAGAVQASAAHRAIEQSLADLTRDLSTLHELHEMQVWRLIHWRAARETLTYRRFFEIADLVGLKVERPRAFDELHARLGELVSSGSVDGLRLDHIDGLANPKEYLERLQKAWGEKEPVYLLVEKVLAPREELRSDWPVAGTTGYEFIRVLAELLVDSRGEATMTRAYWNFLKHEADYETLVVDTKRRIVTRNLAGELERLKEMAGALAARQLATRDLGTDTLRRAIIEVAAALPVYRTYVDVTGAQEEDRAIIKDALSEAKATREVEDEEAIDFLGRVLELDIETPEDQASALEFATRFQQTTGPIMAKALEDTVFYRYNRLIALNEVGGVPQRFGAPLAEFHGAMAQRLRRQPAGLSATSTQDTKRGEDARARLYVLSEMPEVWGSAVRHWAELNSLLRSDVDGGPTPEAEVEWMYYQALAGVWPLDLLLHDATGLEDLSARVAQFMLKAVREAKVYTSWTAQNANYERGIEDFTRATLDPTRSLTFLQGFVSTCEPVFIAGALNSLSQAAIKLIAPGVPDVYQGSELWDLSLVDPDNRRPVDFNRREAVLANISEGCVDAYLTDWRSGVVKLHLLQAGLRLRASAEELFKRGDYVPIVVEGTEAERVVAFARVHDKEAVIAIVPRTSLGLLCGQSMPLVPGERWGDTAIKLPQSLLGHHFRNILTGESVTAERSFRLDELLHRFSVAILSNTGPQ
jgi:(1->4)-alpha-D-glucan 1-alpha-D-glucosylmutase